MLKRALHLALAASATFGLAATSAQAATITIKVGASPSLANALVDLIGTFQGYYFDNAVSYNVAVTVDSNANLKAAVLAGGTPSPFDLILTDDSDLVAEFFRSYSAYVEGTPLPFAYDHIDLYSVSLDISHCVTPNFTGPLVIPDPAEDAFGKAAAKILAAPPFRITTIPNARVAVQPNVATAQAGIELGMYPYGVVPKSAICTSPAGTPVYPEGSYHHELPAPLNARYGTIPLTAVKVVNGARSADQVTELTAFTNFLTGAGTALGTDVLKRFCYQLSPQ